MLLLTTPPLGFYSTVALVLPVLFLAAMVEMRVSVAAPLLEKEESETQLTLRVAAFVVALSALVLGEAGSFDALWYGAGSGIDGPVAAVGLGLLGVVLLLPLADRLHSDIDAGGPEQGERVRRRVKWAGGVCVGLAVGLLIGGRL